MNVFDAESGSCLKAKTACCAATKTLLVLMFKSLVKSAKGRESGSLGSFEVAAAASESISWIFGGVSVIPIFKILTVVYYNAWESQ